MRPYRFLLKTLAAAWLSWGLLALVFGASLVVWARESLPLVVGLIFLGTVYTQLVEYAVHRLPMHRRIPGLLWVRKSHLMHHRLFHGRHFQTRDPDRLRHAAGRWYGFPILLFVHVMVFSPIFGPGLTAWILLGAVIHYTAFEWGHWACHVEDNGIDRRLLAVPWVGDIRRGQIEHHRHHHEVPVDAFNVTAPYLGDHLAVVASRLPELMVRTALWLDPRDMPLASPSSLRRGLAALLLALATISKAQEPAQTHQVHVSDASRGPDTDTEGVEVNS